MFGCELLFVCRNRLPGIASKVLRLGQLLSNQIKDVVFLEANEAHALVGSRHADAIVRVDAAQLDAIPRDKPFAFDAKRPKRTRRAHNRANVQRMRAHGGDDDAIKILRNDRTAGG